MSTIKSSSEDLTLNADGSNEVKFQINAVEKTSINSSGLFTSTNIDATVLTGNLPAISGASLTSLPSSANYDMITTTFDMSSGNGATTDISGASFNPTHAFIICSEGTAANTSWGFGDGTFDGVIYDNHVASANTFTSNVSNTCYALDTSGNFQAGTLSLIATGVRITWAKTGSPTGTTRLFAMLFG